MLVANVEIEAPPEEHDAILVDRVALWASSGPVSFLRANKPVWRLEITRHDASTLTVDEEDAVADSALVLKLIALERRGTPVRSRRELVLRAMRRVTDALELSQEGRRTLHREGYEWAVRLGRWDDAGIAALERRYESLRDGIIALLASPCDPDSEARWRLLARRPGPPDAAIEQGRQAIGVHANRLGVFAEAEAILHYMLFRLDSDSRGA